MKDQIKSAVDKTKQFWQQQPKKKKVILGSVAGGVILFAVLITVLLNISGNKYKVLYPGMDSTEATQVYAALQGMDVQPQINKQGQLMVPEEQWDTLLFELAGQGFPKTTLSYDTFLNNTGFTTTEFEKKQALLFQLQDRMQQTLIRQEGIADAVVSFSIPDTSNYIWDQNNQEESTAGITITMKPGYELTPERVTAIKNLAASSVPKMKPENVVVVDAATGIEVTADGEGNGYSTSRLEFERQIEKSIEDNVKRLLSSKYGADGVTAVAKVELDYDKMKTEQKEYVPQDDGDGVVRHFDESYSVDGNVPVEGIAGEENNTDIPQYPNQTGDGNAQITDYDRNIDYDISYVLTQIERGEPILKSASVAVIVNDSEFDTEREELLVDLISKSVNIPAEDIRVTNLDFQAPPSTPTATTPQTFGPFTSRQWLLIALGGLLLLFLIITAIVMILSRRKKRRQQQELEAQEAAEDQRRLELEKEIADHKRMLQEEAQASVNTKENAIAEEIRDFAEQNPEITATLIRSLLKEED